MSDTNEKIRRAQPQLPVPNELDEVDGYIRATITQYEKEVARIQGQIMGLYDALGKVKIVLQRREKDEG